MHKVNFDGVPVNNLSDKLVRNSGKAWISEIKHTKVCRKCSICLGSNPSKCKNKVVTIIKKNVRGEIDYGNSGN